MFTAPRADPRSVASRVTHAIWPGIALVLLLPLTLAAQAEPEWAALRQALVKEIEADAARTAFETGRPAFSQKVMDAMSRVPRHRFVLPGTGRAAYDNRPLGIGHGQTISQPYIVALMTDLLEPQPGHVVLEVGTGSAYQAAVLGELVKKVYSVEIIKPLAESASKRLSDLGYRNITTRESDGYYGWKEHAPFDGIMVTAAASSIPPPLIEQLKPGGRLVIPVGGAFFTQYLMLVTKSADGSVTTEQILPVRFVPLTGKH